MALIILSRRDPRATSLFGVIQLFGEYPLWLTKTLGGGRSNTVMVDLSDFTTQSMRETLAYCCEHPLPLLVLPETARALLVAIESGKMEPNTFPVVVLTKSNMLGDVGILAVHVANSQSLNRTVPGFYDAMFEHFTFT